MGIFVRQGNQVTKYQHQTLAIPPSHPQSHPARLPHDLQGRCRHQPVLDNAQHSNTPTNHISQNIPVNATPHNPPPVATPHPAPNPLGRWGDVADPRFGDVHLYFYDKDALDPLTYPPAKFVSEFGFMSFPSFAGECKSEGKKGQQKLQKMKMPGQVWARVWAHELPLLCGCVQ